MFSLSRRLLHFSAATVMGLAIAPAPLLGQQPAYCGAPPPTCGPGGCCTACKPPADICTCTSFKPVVDTCYHQQQTVTYRDVCRTCYKQQPYCETVPVTK